MNRRRRSFRTILILANLGMLAVPTFAVAGGGDDLAAGLAIGCCAGMAAASMIEHAEHKHDRHRDRDRVHVTEVHHYQAAPPPPPPTELHPGQARAELLASEQWARTHCEPTIEQPDNVQVYVTFRGSDGNVVRTQFDPPLRGGDFHQCMTAAYFRGQISPFSAQEQTVRKSLGG